MTSNSLGRQEWTIIALVAVAWGLSLLYVVSWYGFYDFGIPLTWELMMGAVALAAHLATYFEVKGYGGSGT